MAQYNDLQIILHEETLNNVFGAIGEIKGSQEYEVLLIKGKYHWTVKNPRINLLPSKSTFTCDAIVDVGPINYKTQVLGDVTISYDNVKNKIAIQITSAIFELYTKILGKKIHIKDIDLAKYFKDPFLFDGPRSYGADFEFMAPDSTVKKVYMQPSACKLLVVKQQIITQCEMAVSDKPFPKDGAPIMPEKPAPAVAPNPNKPKPTKK